MNQSRIEQQSKILGCHKVKSTLTPEKLLNCRKQGPSPDPEENSNDSNEEIQIDIKAEELKKKLNEEEIKNKENEKIGEIPRKEFDNYQYKKPKKTTNQRELFASTNCWNGHWWHSWNHIFCGIGLFDLTIIYFDRFDLKRFKI